MNIANIRRILFLFCAILTSFATLTSCNDHIDGWGDEYDYLRIYGIKGRRCVVIRSNVKHNGHWIVRPAFIGAFPQVDDSLLNKGYTFAFYDVTHSYATPDAQKDFNFFYQIIRRRYHLDKSFIMEGLSRGGYFALTYAINHPEQIDKLYLDAPVCDLYSWPAQKDSSLFNDASLLWRNCGTPIDSIHDFPIKNIQAIKDIPTIVVYGDQDDVVPFQDNFGRIDTANFARISLIKKEGMGHHPHSLTPCDTIVNFLTQ